MIWRRETPHLLVSDKGYKIGKYRAGEETFYRPSLKGDFISRPFKDLDAAKSECDRHFEGGGNRKPCPIVAEHCGSTTKPSG